MKKTNDAQAMRLLGVLPGLAFCVTLAFALSRLPNHGLFLSYDGFGHVAKARYYSDELFGKVDGYFPYWHGGFQVFRFYPPGFYWVVTILSELSCGHLSIEAAVKLVSVLSAWLFPIGVWVLLREMDVGPLSVSGAVLIAAIMPELGGWGAITVFRWGLLPNALAMSLFPFVLWCSFRALRTGRMNWFVTTSIGTSSVLCIHTFTGLMLYVTVLVSIIVSAVHKEYLWRSAKLAIALLASSVSAAWWIVPALAYQDHFGIPEQWKQLNLSELGSFALSTFGQRPILICSAAVLVLVGLVMALCQANTAIVTMCVSGIVGFVLSTGALKDAIPFAEATADKQSLRFVPFVTLFASIVVVYGINAIIFVLPAWSRCSLVAFVICLVGYRGICGAAQYGDAINSANENTHFVSLQRLLSRLGEYPDRFLYSAIRSERLVTLTGSPFIVEQLGALAGRARCFDGNFPEGTPAAVPRRYYSNVMNSQVPLLFPVQYIVCERVDAELWTDWKRIDSDGAFVVLGSRNEAPVIRGERLGVEVLDFKLGRDEFMGTIVNPHSDVERIRLPVSFDPCWQVIVGGKKTSSKPSAEYLLEIAVPSGRSSIYGCFVIAWWQDWLVVLSAIGTLLIWGVLICAFRLR